MSDYWSERKFKNRIKWYDEDIKKLRHDIEICNENGNSFWNKENREILNSLIQSKKMHIMAYKVLSKAKQTKLF